MKDTRSNKEINMVSLNDPSFEEFSIEELEQRLETAPWICGVNDNEVDITLPGEEPPSEGPGVG